MGAELHREDVNDGPPAADPRPEQLTPQEVQEVLLCLAGTCYQVHVDWWSYEWCPWLQVRQFQAALTIAEEGRTPARRF